MRKKIFTVLISLSFAFLFFASDCICEEVKITGELKDTYENAIPRGKITAIQDNTSTEQYATEEGRFELLLHPGPVTIIYQVPGYAKLEDNIRVDSKTKKREKIMKRSSVGGWWTLLLLIPGVCGLGVAWCKECFGKDRGDNHVIQDRLLVALLNGVIWAVVLAMIWYGAAYPNGITKIQFFHSSLTFEFFVPLLGYLGAMLYVFDLFRGKDNDKFKEKEFGMRIVMGPYVAMVVVALFGKDFSIIDLESDTGQGALAFASGLIVVVVFQGLIERANEALGKWRRESSPYTASPIAKKFHLSEDEDNELRKISIRHPEQLIMWSAKDLSAKVSETNFDNRYILWMKRYVESEELTKDIGDLIWERLKLVRVTTLHEFANLSNKEIQKFAKKKPELSDARLIDLKNMALHFLNSNGEYVEEKTR